MAAHGRGQLAPAGSLKGCLSAHQRAAARCLKSRRQRRAGAGTWAARCPPPARIAAQSCAAAWRRRKSAACGAGGRALRRGQHRAWAGAVHRQGSPAAARPAACRLPCSPPRGASLSPSSPFVVQSGLPHRHHLAVGPPILQHPLQRRQVGVWAARERVKLAAARGVAAHGAEEAVCWRGARIVGRGVGALSGWGTEARVGQGTPQGQGPRARGAGCSAPCACCCPRVAAPTASPARRACAPAPAPPWTLPGCLQ